MPKIELDEEEVRRLAGLEKTVSTLWANPKARLLIQQAQKLVDPNAKTPDLDQQAQVMAPVEEVRKEFREYIAKTEAKEAEAEKTRTLNQIKQRHDEGIAVLRREHKYTDEGIKAVEALMEEKGILDPLDAAAVFERMHPPQTPVASSGGTGAWNFTDVQTGDGDVYAKKLFDSKGQLDAIVEQEARVSIQEVRGAGRR